MIFNPSPNKQVFWKHWEKEKLLITSNFSFSHSVFYLFGKLSAIFIRFKIVVCKLFQFGRVLNLSFGKELRNKWRLYMSIRLYFLHMLILDLHYLKKIHLKALTFYQTTRFYTGPNWKYLQTTKCDWKIEFFWGKGRKHRGKRRKCWLPAFSSFPTMFPKGSFICMGVIKSCDCVVNS